MTTLDATIPAAPFPTLAALRPLPAAGSMISIIGLSRRSSVPSLKLKPRMPTRR